MVTLLDADIQDGQALALLSCHKLRLALQPSLADECSESDYLKPSV